MNSTTKKIVSAGMALLMSMSIGTSAFAAGINTAQLRSDLKTGTERLVKDSADDLKFAAQAQSAPGYWSSHFSKNGQTAYMLVVNAVKNFQTKVQVPNFDKNEFQQFGNVFKKEYPELFYAKDFHWKGNTEAGNQHTTYTISWNQDSNAKSEAQALNSAVSKFLSGAPTSGSDYDKELYVHDKLVKDTTYSKGHGTVYDALVSHQANCDGYSSAMKVLLNKLNVPCEIVVGTATNEGAHAWNVVTLNGKKYLTDTTWDDPNPVSTQHALSHRYFNLTADEMNRDHKATKSSEQSGCSNTDQNWYVKNNKVYSSAAEAEKVIADQMNTETMIYVKLSSSSEAKKVYDDWKSGKLKMPAGTSWGVEKSKNQNGFANGVLVFYKNQK